MYNIMVINLGSTKIALFQDEALLRQENVDHPVEQISAFPTVFDQLDFRLEMILDMLKAKDDEYARLCYEAMALLNQIDRDRLRKFIFEE